MYEPGSEPILSYGSLVVDLGRCQARLGKRPLNLTAAEFNLLAFLLAHPDEILTRKQILDRVWLDGASVGERAVDARIQRLRKKLGRRAGLIKTVRGAGYRFTPEGNKKRRAKNRSHTD